MLSVYNGAKWSATDAFEHFAQQGFTAVGNMAVSVGECAATELVATEDNDPFEGHAFIDFRSLSAKQAKIKGRELKEIALARDWTYRP